MTQTMTEPQRQALIHSLAKWRLDRLARGRTDNHDLIQCGLVMGVATEVCEEMDRIEREDSCEHEDRFFIGITRSGFLIEECNDCGALL